jgi:hypothetical protein
MREWVYKQELLGNTIKFSLFDSKYCVGFQRTTYNGMKPHFFVYEILKRKVTRRFLPLLDPFKSEWLIQRDVFNMPSFVAKKSPDSGDDSEIDGSSIDSNLAEDYAEDVSVFEVSPQGSYLVALVSNEFVTLKMLNRSLNPMFRKMLTPSFMITEHIDLHFEENKIDLPVDSASGGSSRQVVVSE